MRREVERRERSMLEVSIWGPGGERERERACVRMSRVFRESKGVSEAVEARSAVAEELEKGRVAGGRGKGCCG